MTANGAPPRIVAEPPVEVSFEEAISVSSSQFATMTLRTLHERPGSHTSLRKAVCVAMFVAELNDGRKATILWKRICVFGGR